MARVTGQSVPPSLTGALGRYVTMAKTGQQGRLDAKINPQGLDINNAPGMVARAKLAHDVATWFTSMWPTNQINGSTSEFFAARRADILNGGFPDQWWTPATQFADETEYGVPQGVVPRTYPGDPEYFDTLHKPTRCEVKTISAIYGTPASQGTEQQPAPGWRGITIDSYFQDLYHAQRRVRFALPRTLAAADKRPLAIKIDYTIHTESSTRGNRYWFNLTTYADHYFGMAGPPSRTRKPQTFWARMWAIPVVMPAKSPAGWAFTHSATTVRDGRPNLKAQFNGMRNYVDVVVSTPPSHGLYYSRNSWVHIWHTHTVALYVPRAYRE